MALRQLVDQWRASSRARAGRGGRGAVDGGTEECAPSHLVAACSHGELPWAARVAMRLLVSRLELLCVSEELEPERQRRCSAICEEAEAVNAQLASAGPRLVRVECADLVEAFVRARSARLARKLLAHPTPEDVLSVAEDEVAWARAVLSTIAARTTLLPARQEKGNGVEEMGRRACGEVWRWAAVRMVVSAAALLPGEAESLLRSLRKALDHEGLHLHAAARSCLQHVCSHLGRQEALAQWDSAFQELLTAQHAEARKGFRLLHSPAPSTLHLLSRVLPPLTSHCRALCSAPAAADPCTRPLVAQHLSGLLLSSWLLTALCASLDCATSHLRRAAACTLPGGSTAAAARLWLEDGAKTSEAGAGAEGEVRLVASPLLSFPPSSVLHTFEAGSMERLAQLHAARQRLEGTVQTLGQAVCNQWRAQCSRLLREAFPSHKRWKALGKSQRDPGSPSHYCQLIQEQLLAPLTRAAATLPPGSQQTFLAITFALLISELRTAITSLTKTYRPSAGRQLMADFHHLRDSLASSQSGLHPDTSASLTHLPPLTEMERGLQELCGSGKPGSSQPGSSQPGSSQPSSGQWPSAVGVWAGLLPVMAPPTSSDWTECIL